MVKAQKALFSLLLILSFSVKAEAGFDMMYSAGLTSGGDTLIKATSSSGSTSLKAGGLIYLSIGSVYKFEDPRFQIQGSFGYHFDTLHADNGTADFERVFFEIIPFYAFDDKIRLGVGIVNVFAPSYSDPFDKVEFDDAIGTVVEIDWRLSKNGWWGIRAVNLDYDATSINGFPAVGTIDGNYLGLMVHGGF